MKQKCFIALKQQFDISVIMLICFLVISCASLGDDERTLGQESEQVYFLKCQTFPSKDFY